MLPACGLVMSPQTVQPWVLKFGQAFANDSSSAALHRR